MQQNRSRIIWIAAIVVAFFFLVDPFRLFSGGKIPETRTDRDTVQQYSAFLASAPTAVDTVLDLLRDSDVVLIGETSYTKQHAQFAADLIPALDAEGIRYLGYEYASSADQAKIDDLVTATSFDEDLARRILFDQMVIFGFQEHVNIFRAAWEVNRRKGEGDAPFRIIGLSTPPVYSEITGQDDVKDPQVMRRVFARGVPDDLMAEVIATTFLERNRKAAVYVQAERAFTSFRQQGYEEQMAEIGFPDALRTGNRLYRDYGSRVVSAILHGPVRDARSRIGFGYPLGGLVDKAYLQIPEPRSTVGFRTADAPFAQIEMTSNVLLQGRDTPLTFEQYADAYLILTAIGNLEPVTPIPDFITSDNLARAVADFPGTSPGNASAEDLNSYMANNAEQMANVFKAFR